MANKLKKVKYSLLIPDHGIPRAISRLISDLQRSVEDLHIEMSRLEPPKLLPKKFRKKGEDHWTHTRLIIRTPSPGKRGG